MLLSVYDVSYKQRLQLCPKGRETTVRHSQCSGQAVQHCLVVFVILSNCHHPRVKENHVFVPMPVNSSSTGECGLIPKHNDEIVNLLLQPLHTLHQFVCLQLRAGEPNNSNSNDDDYYYYYY